MCGIVGYIGQRSALPIVVGGLEALEYRGYDSAGIAAIENGQGLLTKQAGRVQGLKQALPQETQARLAIGHTRWATHGAPTTNNAHPHTNADKTIFVVHNGIIENYLDIKTRLQAAGYNFVSETDTEVIPHLIDYYLQKLGSLYEAFDAALADLRGAYAIAMVSTHEPGKLYTARLSSPLVIGVGEDEYILASDAMALMEHTQKVIYLDDYDVAVISSDNIDVHNTKKEGAVEPQTELLDYDNDKALLGDFPHFMLKEIFDIPATIRSATLGRISSAQNLVKLGGLDEVVGQLKYIDRIVIVACGTSYYAGLIGEYLIEELAGIPVEVQLASEFKYRKEPFSRSTALIAISQSGETADTIAALKKVEDYGVLSLGIVNNVGSTIARITDAGVYCHAGPEQAVACTKVFVSMLTVLTEIALHLNNGSSELYKPIIAELEQLPEKAQRILDQAETIKQVAEKYKDYSSFLLIGRRYGYPSALEGALKLKECTLIHAEGYAAGEMKHGPLAMIDENFPTLAIATNSALLEKTQSNIEEIRARGGPVVAIISENSQFNSELVDDVIVIPESLEQTEQILVAVVVQLFSYYIAVARGFDVDRPRNLAKSVTVE